MRIDQMLPSFGNYDAIGNDVRLMASLLRQEGYFSDIFTDQGHHAGLTKPYRQYACYASPGNILIHHYSIGSDLPYYLQGIDSYKVTRYHNITPARYFPYTSSLEAHFRCREGRGQLPIVRGISDTYWTTSHYNAEELSAYQFEPGYVLPVLRRYDELAKGGSCARTSKLLQASPKKNLLFVGRIMPHKGHHDLIFLLKQYQRFVDENLRLIFVGGMEPYYGQKVLTQLARDLGLSYCFSPKRPRDFDADIIFAGTTSEAELASYYREAHVFASMSEHEGFCVPVVEAMYFGLPILAHTAAAVPETLGDAAYLVDKNDPVATLEGLASLLHNGQLCDQYRYRSSQRALDFSWDALQTQFKQGLQAIVERHARLS